MIQVAEAWVQLLDCVVWRRSGFFGTSARRKKGLRYVRDVLFVKKKNGPSSRFVGKSNDMTFRQIHVDLVSWYILFHRKLIIPKLTSQEFQMCVVGITGSRGSSPTVGTLKSEETLSKQLNSSANKPQYCSSISYNINSAN